MTNAHPNFKAAVIGASAGAVEALSAVLSPLPAELRLAIIVVVHIPADRNSLLANLFDFKCKLRVKEVEDNETIEPGTVYFAPPDYHIMVERNGCLSLSNEEHVLFSRPSIDVLFESAADAYGSTLVGIVLTGANSDGAKGLRGIVESGGFAIVQDPQTSFASAMPKAALELCPEALILTLEGISDYLKRIAGNETT